MTVAVESVPVENGDEVARCRVYTEDGLGLTRTYQISLGPDKVDGGYVMAGREANDPTGDPSVSSRAFGEAADHFRGRGFEVWNHE